MKASCGLYPALGQYFETKKELAYAGGMSRSRLDDCLNGRKEFTESEKVSIYHYLMMKTIHGMVMTGRDFDEQFKIQRK